MSESVKQLKAARARKIEQRLVQGSPAESLLEVAGSNPANLIVVGNRGVGAQVGEVLGEVPREVVKNAVCNVMVVQIGTGERAAPDEEDQTLAPGGQSPDQDDQTEP